MDKAERAMYKPVPDGYVRIKEGPIQPTDLCLSVFEGKWLEFGSTDWLSPALNADEAFMVARPRALALAMASPIDQIYGTWR